MIHGESRRRFDVHLRPLQRREQRRGRLVAARNVEHTRPSHRHGLREQHLLGPGARDVDLHQIHAALGDLRLNIHSIVAAVQIRLRRSDLMTLRSNPDARRNRARAVDLQCQHKLFAREHVLRRCDALHLHWERRCAARRHGKYGNAAFSCAQRFGQCVPAILVAIADQQNSPRSLCRKCTEGQLHRAFDIGSHSFLRINTFRNAHLVRLLGNGTQGGALRESNQAQIHAGFFANQIAQHALAMLQRFTRHAGGSIHQNRHSEFFDAHRRPGIRESNGQRREGRTLQR